MCASVSIGLHGRGGDRALGDLSEADLDIEWAGGIAKNATVVLYLCLVVRPELQNRQREHYGVFDALQYAVEDYTVPSTGECCR